MINYYELAGLLAVYAFIIGVTFWVLYSRLGADMPNKVIDEIMEDIADVIHNHFDAKLMGDSINEVLSEIEDILEEAQAD